MFLLVLAHPGCSGQNAESRETVCVCVVCVYSDFDNEELEMLARSASESEDDGVDDEMGTSSDKKDASTDDAEHSAVTDKGLINRTDDSDTDSDDVIENISLSDSDTDGSE